MDRRHFLGLLVVLVVGVVTAFVLTTPTALGSDQYPAGAGPNHINFSTLNAADTNVSHTPREYWDSYVIDYNGPPERPLVEGDYHINSQTGEIISERWDDATVYLNGSTYAFVQPAKSIPTRQREELELDDAFVYDNGTNAYYRYDSYYGRVAPTNIGRHTTILESYSWEARNEMTHHGVPVITYQVTGKRTKSSNVPPAINGTLQLGVEDGVIYAFDITLDSERPYQYTYDVQPAAFPDHDWVDTARDLTARNTTSTSGSERQRLRPAQ